MGTGGCDGDWIVVLGWALIGVMSGVYVGGNDDLLLDNGFGDEKEEENFWGGEEVK